MSEHFGDVLTEFIESQQRSSGQLSVLSGVPKHTIVSWREGRVKRPRSIGDILKVAQALNLNMKDANRLLSAAGKSSIQGLMEKSAQEANLEYHDLLQKWQAGDAPQAVPLPMAAIPMTAPRATINFVNRSELLMSLEDALLDSRLCSLWGMGGIGKTETAKQIVARIQSSFPDGVLWANLNVDIDDGLSDDQRVNATLGSWLKLCGWQLGNDGAAFESTASRAQVLRTILSQRKMLLVLDDVSTTESVEWFLPPAGSDCALLLTTRNSRVARTTEHMFQIAPLPLGDSVELIKEFIGEQRLYENEASVRHLAHLLGGHPLALAVVGSDLEETRSLTIHEYHSLLQDEHMRLSHLSDWDDKSRSVQATFELSYRRMPKESQELLLALSLFGDNDFSVEAVAAMLKQPTVIVKRQLGRLCSLSLLTEITSTDGDVLAAELRTRYRLHRLVHVFAHEKRDECTQPSNLESRRIAEYFAAFVSQNAAQPYHLLPIEWPNILRVLSRLEEHTEWLLFEKLLAPLTEISMGLAGYLDSSGNWRIAIQLCEKLRASQILNERSTDLASFLIKQATFEQRIGQYSDALNNLELAQQYLDDILETEESQQQLLHVYIAELKSRIYEQSDRLAAREQIETAISILQEITGLETNAEAGYLFIRRGSIVGQMGALGEALADSLYGLSLLPSIATSAHASGLTNVGIIHDLQGRSDDALSAWQEAMTIADSIGDLRRSGILWTNMGIAESKRGRLHAAIEYKNRAIDCYEPFGFVEGQAMLYANLAENYILTRELDIARGYLDDAEALSHEHDLKPALLVTLINRIWLELELHQQSIEFGHDTLLTSKAGTQVVFESTHHLELCHSLWPEMVSLQSELGEPLWDSEINRLAIELDLAENKVTDAATKMQSLLAQENLSQNERGLALRLYGAILFRREEFTNSFSAFQEAIKLFEQTNEFELARTLLTLGRYQIGMADEDESFASDGMSLLEKAENIFRTLGHDAYLEVLPNT